MSGWYSYGFGQETMAPEQYLQKTGSDYAQNLYLEEPEPEYETDYTLTLQPEKGAPVVAKKPASGGATPIVEVVPPPPPVQAGFGWAAVLGLGLLGAFLWMKK